MLDLLTTRPHRVVVHTNMKAELELLIDEHYVLDGRTFVEIVVWRLDRPVRGSTHRFKYRLALVSDSTCVLRYDNEAGKGDHLHIGGAEKHYNFADFRDTVSRFLE